MTGATFREARADDLPALVQLLADDVIGATREAVCDPVDPRYVRAMEAIARSPNDRLIVAELDGAVVGCAQLTVLPGLSNRGMLRAQIEGVRVASALRGGGLGAALITDLVERARASGCGVVQLTSSVSRTRARAFYERLGFQATHVGMKLDLAGRG